MSCVSLVSLGGVGHALEWNELTQLTPKHHENKPREGQGRGRQDGGRCVLCVLGVFWRAWARIGVELMIQLTQNTMKTSQGEPGRTAGVVCLWCLWN